METTSKTKYIVIGAIIIILIIVLSASYSGTPGGQSTSTQSVNTSATTSSSQASPSSASAAPTVSGQTYSNKLLGFSFTNPRPGSWVMNVNSGDGSLVSFGPQVSQVGVGVKVYYWSGSQEFPLFGKITTITDLKNAVSEKYKQVIPSNINVIYAGGLSMVEVKGLAAGFGTTNAYFVLLPSGTLNFGGTGSLSGYIHKI